MKTSSSVLAAFVLLAFCLPLRGSFDAGGKSVHLPQAPEARKITGPNYVYNGSFEEPGTRPDGWNMKAQKGWIGFLNFPKAKDEEEAKRFRILRKSCTRSLVSPGSHGEKALSILIPDFPEAHRKGFHCSSKVYQDLKVPKVPAQGAKYLVSLKARGSSGNKLFLFVQSQQLQADGKGKALAPSLIRSFPLTPEWRTINQPVTLKPGCDQVNITLANYAVGELYADEISFTAVTGEALVQVYSTPAENVDRRHYFGEKTPGMLTFVFDHAGKIPVKKLRLGVELPPEFALLDHRQIAPLQKKDGNTFYFDLMKYPLRHLQDFYQYQAFSLWLKSDRPAGTEEYPLRYWVEDEGWKSPVKELKLMVMPAFRGRTPRQFKVAAMLGHEVEFGPEGTRQFGEFYRNSGSNAVHGANHNPGLAKQLKSYGIERYNEIYYIANGYRLGSGPIPEQAQFRRLDGTAYPRKVCPYEVYSKGEYFRSKIVPLIEKYILKQDVTDHIMPNWEPYYLDSRGCFCPRCREEFIRYCRGRIAAEEIRAAWPKDILRKYLPVWQKFRSYQHGRLCGALQEAVTAAGARKGIASYFIPEITNGSLDPKFHSATAQYNVSDYMDKLPWLAPWGPYLWHDLRRYNESFPANHLIMYSLAGHLRKCIDAMADDRNIPRNSLIAMPHGWQDSFWVTTPEEISHDIISFFLQKWEGCFVYFFPRGYDYRYWSSYSRACDQIARYEDFVFKGEDISERLQLIPETGLPRTCFPGRWEVQADGSCRVPGLHQASPVQGRAFGRGGRILIAAGNFWERGEHFFKMKLTGLSGRYEVSTEENSCGIFSGDELAAGILMQTGALRWQFITLEKRDAPGKLPLFNQDDLKKLERQRLPEIEKALAAEKKLYNERFGAQDFSSFKPVEHLGLRAAVQNDKIEITDGKKTWKMSLTKNSGVESPHLQGSPAFWWTAAGAIDLNCPFKLKKMAATAQGIEIIQARTLTPRDSAPLSGLELTMRYHFIAGKPNGWKLHCTAVLRNTNVDSVSFAFRFRNMLPADSFRFGAQLFHRNMQVSLFRFGDPDGELDRIYAYERQVKVSAGKMVCGDTAFQSLQPLYGVVVWDDARQKMPTFEPVYPKLILAPGATVSYSWNEL